MARPQENIVTGLDEIDKGLKHFERKVANRIARAVLRAGSQTAAKQMKRSIPSSEKRIRKAIGWSVKKSKGGASRGVTQAKAGASVGSAASKNRSIETDRDGKGGVGISAYNIHWWLLGTNRRVQKTTGKQTGAMPRQHGSLGQVAAQASGVIFRDMRRAGIREFNKAEGKK